VSVNLFVGFESNKKSSYYKILIIIILLILRFRISFYPVARTFIEQQKIYDIIDTFTNTKMFLLITSI
jgi:hypothetical protein